MRPYNYVAVLLLAFAIGGSACEQKSSITPAESVLLTCSAYTAALNTLASAREQGKLNADTVAIVDHVRETVNPLCLGPAPNVNATVKDVAVDAGVRTLQSIIAQTL